MLRPGCQPRVRCARDSGLRTFRDSLAGQVRPEPPRRYRSHWVDRSDQQTHPGQLPRSHDPLGRQEGRTYRVRGGRRAHGRETPKAKVFKRGKGARIGYTYLHTAIDGFSRLACTEALDDEKASTMTSFVCRVRAFLVAHGVTRFVWAVTNNGVSYRPRPSSRLSSPWPHATRGSPFTPYVTTTTRNHYCQDYALPMRLAGKDNQHPRLLPHCYCATGRHGHQTFTLP